MHATKSFAVGEAGLLYSGDPDRIARLRAMSNFGFGEPRTATMPGLNGKLSEVGALLGQLRLAALPITTASRHTGPRCSITIVMLCRNCTFN
jgi:dTDP-4-amino-4,6-dideoxygalactose transaminase